MSSSSNNADLFNRLQLFRARSEDLEDEDGQRKRIDPSQSRVKRYIITQCEKNEKFVLILFFTISGVFLAEVTRKKTSNLPNVNLKKPLKIRRKDGISILPTKGL